MLNRIKLGFNEGSEFTAEIPEAVRNAALDIDPNLMHKLRELDARDYLRVRTTDDSTNAASLTVSLDMYGLGLVRDFERKAEQATAITEVLGTLLFLSATDDTCDEKLQLTHFMSTYSGEFGIVAGLDVPSGDPELITDMVKAKMVRAQLAMRYLHDTPIDIETRSYIAMTHVILDDMGVDLRLSVDSGVHNLAHNHVPGSKHLEVVGNNISSYGEPLVYLIGMTALSHADELLT